MNILDKLNIGDLFIHPYHNERLICILLGKTKTSSNLFIKILYLVVIDKKIDEKYYLTDTKCRILC